MRARVLALTAAAVLGNAVLGGAVGGATAAADVCAEPRVSVSDAPPQYEGSDGGVKTVSLTVTLTQPQAGCPATGSVRYRTVDGTATAGEDYVATTGILSWTTPGPRVIGVQVVRDDVYEQDEQFGVELFGPRGMTIADGSATVSVLDDDAGKLHDGLVVAVPQSGICWWPSEHCTALVRLNTIARAPVSVYLRTVDGTAVGGKDYVPIKDLLVTIRAGADEVEVPVEVMEGAAPGEHFFVVIRGATAGTIGTEQMKITFQAA